MSYRRALLKILNQFKIQRFKNLELQKLAN